MGKSKVHQFQICCARTKYPSEIHKRWTIIVCTAIDNRAANSALYLCLNLRKFRFLLSGLNQFVQLKMNCMLDSSVHHALASHQTTGMESLFSKLSDPDSARSTNKYFQCIFLS